MWHHSFHLQNYVELNRSRFRNLPVIVLISGKCLSSYKNLDDWPGQVRSRTGFICLDVSRLGDKEEHILILDSGHMPGEIRERTSMPHGDTTQSLFAFRNCKWEGTRISLGVWSLLLFCVIPVFFLLLSSDEDWYPCLFVPGNAPGQRWSLEVAVVMISVEGIIVNDIQTCSSVASKANVG